MTNGTPKTLDQAIANGIESNDIYNHVKDFLAQHFSVAILGGMSNEALWLRIIARDVTRDSKERVLYEKD